jgi:hypothetical protein
MESTGYRNRIHCSQATATLLERAGKSWATPRDDLVHAKGKGELQTYWIELAKKSNPSPRTGSTSSFNSENSVDHTSGDIQEKEWTRAGLGPTRQRKEQKNAEMEEKERRLVDWNTDVLCRLLKQVIVKRHVISKSHSESSHRRTLYASNTDNRSRGNMVIDEVVEIIELPKSQVVYEQEMMEAGRKLALGPTVVEQVRSYVQATAALYPKNHFHNFEHVRCFSFCGELMLMGTNLMLCRAGFACGDECFKDAVKNGRCFRE